MAVKKYNYDKKKFCVPVTKAEPLDAIEFIINDFKDKKVTFCIDGENESWEVWRHVEDGDSDKIKKSGSPHKPKFLYVEGKEIETYETMD